jgi:protein-disulfide isomerase
MKSLNDLDAALRELERRAEMANTAYAARRTQPAADPDTVAQRSARPRLRRAHQLAQVTAVTVVAVVVAGGALAAWHFWPKASGGSSYAPGVAAPPGASAAASGIVADPGAPPTPVLAIYQDYQCPMCAKVHQTMSPVIASAVATNSIRIEYRTMTFLDQVDTDATAETADSSTRAANAAACADAAGHFVAYDDYLMNHQPKEGDGYTEQALRQDAPAAVGITGQGLADFQHCYDTRQFGDFVAGVNRAATAAGIEGTPVYVLDGVPVTLSTADALQISIDASLAGHAPATAQATVTVPPPPGPPPPGPPVVLTGCVATAVDPTVPGSWGRQISGTASNPAPQAVVYWFGIALTDSLGGPMMEQYQAIPVAAGATVQWQATASGAMAVDATGPIDVGCSVETVSTLNLVGPDLPQPPTTADALTQSLQRAVAGVATVTADPNQNSWASPGGFHLRGSTCPAAATCGVGVTDVTLPAAVTGTLTAGDGRTGDFTLTIDYLSGGTQSSCSGNPDPSCQVTTLGDGSTLWASTFKLGSDDSGVTHSVALDRSDGLEIRLEVSTSTSGDSDALPLTLAQLQQTVTAMTW